MAAATGKRMWKHCKLCSNTETFATPFQFSNHLRSYHSKIEGGSHVCCYGPNSMCPQLPYEGVSGRDYETHIAKCHIFSFYGNNHAANHQNSNENNFNDDVSVDMPVTEVADKNSGENSGWRTERKPPTGGKGQRSTKTTLNFPRPSATGPQDGRHDKPNVIDAVNWNIFSASQDLTCILNDPAKSRSHYDALFTKDWGPYFVDTSTVAPYATSKKPSQMLFDGYIAKIEKRSRRYFTGTETALRTPTPTDDASSTSSYRLVPALFFEPNFDLTENETFVKLLALFGSDKNGQTENELEAFLDRKSMNDIQRSLSEYLDMVEQDLSQQICRRSNDFFQVMSSMDAIMEKLKDSIKQVSCIRQICHRLKETIVAPIQEIAQLTQLRSRYRDIFRKINWIATVHQTQPTIQLLLSKNDYAGALDLISTSQEVVAQELNGVICLRYLRLQLMEIEKVIEQMLNEEFVKYLTAEWNRPLLTVPDDDDEDDMQKDRLLSIIYGMLKLQNFNFIDIFREEAFTAIKTCVKQTVIETLSFEDNIEVPRIDASLFDLLKCLAFEKWLRCLQTIFDRLVILLKRIVSVYVVINDGFAAMAKNVHLPPANHDQQLGTTTTAATTEDSIASTDGTKVILQGDYLELSASMKDILYSICDFAHSRVANIVELRADDGSLDRFDTGQFMQLTHLIETFVNQCETVCGGCGSSGRKNPNHLKLVIQIQSNKFVSKFHEERKRKLRQLLDLEQWKSVTNVSEDIQKLCSRLVGLDHDRPETTSTLAEIYSEFKNSHKKTTGRSSPSSQCGGNFIPLNGERFVVVNTVINMVYMILDYCQLAEQFAPLAPDILMRLIDLLKSFNSRTSQLILGAEALQVAELKTISARTLMISMRSVVFIQRFIPRIRNHFEPFLKNKQPTSATMLKHLDELNELFENHYHKIPEKVLTLVKEVIAAHIGKWVAKAPIPSAPFQTIAQHLNRLMDNIQDILPPTDLINLFQKIHWLLMSAFKEQVTKLKINNDGGPQHGLVTQELAFYVQNMKKLSIGKELDLRTNDLWSAPASTKAS